MQKERERRSYIDQTAKWTNQAENMAHLPGVGLIKAAAVDVAPPEGRVADEPPVIVGTGAASETQGKQIIKLDNGCKAAKPARERELIGIGSVCVCSSVCA